MCRGMGCDPSRVISILLEDIEREGQLQRHGPSKSGHCATSQEDTKERQAVILSPVPQCPVGIRWDLGLRMAQGFTQM